VVGEKVRGFRLKEAKVGLDFIGWKLVKEFGGEQECKSCQKKLALLEQSDLSKLCFR
jgi:beta-galactosidase GanA